MSEYTYYDPHPSCSNDYLVPVLTASLGGLPAGSVIADLGCGNGSMLAQFRGRGWELHGVEMSASGLAQAQGAYPEIEFHRADLTADLSGHSLVGRCDAVISTEVVEHVFLPRLFARNCHQFLKPKGILIISTPYHGYWKNLVLAASGKLDSHFTALWDYGHIKFWSRQTLTRLLEEAGFAVEEFRGAGRLPWFWKSMVLRAVKG